MQPRAEPGKILITDPTHKNISLHFIKESLGELQIKGKEVPVTTYLLKRARGIRTLGASMRPRRTSSRGQTGGLSLRYLPVISTTNFMLPKITEWTSFDNGF